MSNENNPPGLDCVLHLFFELERVVIREMPDRLNEVSQVCSKWANVGTTAAKRNEGADINWTSPSIADALFEEISGALGIEATSN